MYEFNPQNAAPSSLPDEFFAIVQLLRVTEELS